MNITVTDLTFTYPSGVTALEGVTLTIGSGEAVAIVGENGAGKTTLVKHFNGLLKPTGGTVSVGEWDTRNYTVAKLASRVGYVFQNPDDQLFERTVMKEACFGPKNLGRTADEAEAAGREALDAVGLLGEADKHPYDLHLSQRKLLALAAVLAMRTPVVVLDEPTTGQDGRGIAAIAAIAARLKGERRTVVTITHDIDFAAENFDRVIVMAKGRVIADGRTREVLAQTDVLRAAEVEPPQVARLALAVGMSATPLTPEEFVEELVARE
ncbi:MAG: ATP-binding cassette domain-containing protein [Anaerolineae bacterium]|jgi:energy-coupling factor transport system ATP-binding protein|nr:ATP-binding cassette domain-containing protein [Anaerolineae bacterium]